MGTEDWSGRHKLHQKMLNFSREVQNRNKLILNSSGKKNIFIEEDEV